MDLCCLYNTVNKVTGKYLYCSVIMEIRMGWMEKWIRDFAACIVPAVARGAYSGDL
jgi:hypothetical protein